jgi:hypothetical protein
VPAPFLGENIIPCQAITELIALIESYRHSLKAREADKKFMRKFLFAINIWFQLWLDKFMIPTCCYLPAASQQHHATSLNWNAIMPLYPKAAQEKGRWVILKGDSGPGRMNTELLAELQASGFILFLGVPNTTTVFQETDQNYGPFKHQYATNLDAIVEAGVNQKKLTTLPA